MSTPNSRACSSNDKMPQAHLYVLTTEALTKKLHDALPVHNTYFPVRSCFLCERFPSPGGSRGFEADGLLVNLTKYLLRMSLGLRNVVVTYISAAQEGALSTSANGLIKLKMLLVGVGGINHVYSF